MNMRLIGAPTLADVVPSMVDTHALYTPGPEATMYDANCQCSFFALSLFFHPGVVF